MNYERRMELKAIRAELKALQNRIAAVKDVEEDILARMPEKDQFGVKGEAYEDRIDRMLSAIENIKDAILEVEDAAA